jgi:hypoxanthine phosphoribosyltransferase
MVKPITDVPADVLAAREAAECLFDGPAVERAVDRLAIRLTLALAETHPVIVCVLNGGLPLTAELMLRFHFPLELTYVHATRYRDAMRGAQIEWRAQPDMSVAGRHVLVVDDVLDEGHTLAAVVERFVGTGARSVRTAVLVDKAIGRPRPVAVDDAALTCPDRFLFGHGMDYRGHWRNLAGIYALPIGWTAL